jgi:predicted RNase H-like nuclease
VPKIREVDTFLRAREDARGKIREVHPEVCFWGLSGSPMRHNKKTSAGFSERRDLLMGLYPHTEAIVGDALEKWFRKEVAKDDVLDALAAAVTGYLGADSLKTLPATPERDGIGLPMEMVYYPLAPQAVQARSTVAGR